MYRWIVLPLLWMMPAETAHHVAFLSLRVFAALPGAKALLRALAGKPGPSSQIEVLGLRFPHVLGLAAGFDKDARGYEALAALGFGHVEVGTLTALAQPGNPKPRLFRLKRDSALLNRMGFNNGGAHAAARRLARRRSTVVGVNIGRSKLASNEDALEDYRSSTRALAPHADYFVVNVSSPNTPGLRDLQAVDKLRPLLSAVRDALHESAGRKVALLVKIAPDLADEDVDAVADLALELGLDGIIATNTTISRAGLATDAALVSALGAGGISGGPVRSRSVEVLRRLRSRVGTRLTLISVGGVNGPQEAWERVRAGASLVQLYTAFIYQGPWLAAQIAHGVERLARDAGFERVQDAVGAAADDDAGIPSVGIVDEGLIAPRTSASHTRRPAPEVGLTSGVSPRTADSSTFATRTSSLARYGTPLVISLLLSFPEPSGATARTSLETVGRGSRALSPDVKRVWSAERGGAKDRDGDGVPDAFDPFPDDAERPGVAPAATLFANSSAELFKIDPATLEIERIAAFGFSDGVGRSITDLAIDRFGVLYAVTFDELLVCQPRTARCEPLAYTGGSANALGILPAKSADDPDVMVYANTAGQWTAMTGTPFQDRVATGVLGSGSSGDITAWNGAVLATRKGALEEDEIVSFPLVSSTLVPEVLVRVPLNTYGMADCAGRFWMFMASGDVIYGDGPTASWSRKQTSQVWWGAACRIDGPASVAAGGDGEEGERGSTRKGERTAEDDARDRDASKATAAAPSESAATGCGCR